MIKIEFSGTTAELTGNAWACADPFVLKILTNYTSIIQVGGDVPNVEAFIVDELTKSFPSIRVISRPAPPDDDDTDTIY